ncbi:MAG: hypothetical protein ACREJ2_11795, partial [Planctomycetota bacterium]
MNTELLDTLIAAWLDGTATEPQALALRDALTGSQAAAQRFAQMLYHEHSLQIALTPVAALTGAETETSDGISGSEQSHDPSAVAPARELAGLRDVAALPTQPTRPSRGPRH